MPEQDQPSDEELVRRIAANDEDAFTMLSRRHQRTIYRFALQMSGQPSFAEEAVQETFLALLRQTARFNPARGTLAAFLYGIARHRVLRALERERSYVSIDPEEPAEEQSATNHANGHAGVLEHLSRSQSIAAMRQAVLALPPRYREIVVLCEIEQMSYAHAAEVTGCAVGTVRSRLHRARAFLIRKMRAEEPQPSRRHGSERCLT
jgi:RNA polymerase sigma-70 factor (ECF subfamily)